MSQQFILYPAVIGDSLGLTTLETIVVVLLGAVVAGVPGMLLFLGFLGKIVVPCFKIGIGKKTAQFPGSYILPIAVLAMLAQNMFEPFLLYYVSVMACLFFLFCGYIVAINKEE